MKLNRITNIKQLKAGLYIRVYVSDTGVVCSGLEYVCGVPFRAPSPSYPGTKTWKINTHFCYNGNRVLHESYVDDLMRYAGLYKFSSGAYGYLQSLDALELYQFIKGAKLTVDEQLKLIARWEDNKMMEDWSDYDYQDD